MSESNPHRSTRSRYRFRRSRSQAWCSGSRNWALPGTAVEAVPAWVPLTAGAVAMLLFGARQLRLQRDDRAFLDLRPFTYRRFSVSVGLVVIGFTGLFGAIIMVLLYVQDVLGRERAGRRSDQPARGPADGSGGAVGSGGCTTGTVPDGSSSPVRSCCSCRCADSRCCRRPRRSGNSSSCRRS